MRNRDIYFLLAVALLYRLAFLLLVPRVLDSADSVHYAETARLFLSGEFFAHNPKIPIFYPLLGAFFSLFTRDPEWGCRLVSFVFSTLTVLPVYAITRRLHGARAAWWAGLTVALWPWLADYACAVSTEATAVFLWMTGFWLLLRLTPASTDEVNYNAAHGTESLVGCLASILLSLFVVILGFVSLFSASAAKLYLILSGCIFITVLPIRYRTPGFETYISIPAAAAVVFFVLHLTRAEGMIIAFAGIPVVLALSRDSRARNTWSYLFHLLLLLFLSTLYNRALTGTADPNVRVGYIVEEFDVVRFVETAADTLTDVIPIMLGPVLMVLLGIGLFAPRDHKGHPREGIALLFLASVQVVASWFVLSPAPRYLMAPLIVLTLWSAAGLVILRGWIRDYLATGSAALPRGMGEGVGDTTAAQKRAAPVGGAPMRWLLPHLPALALIAFMLLGTARTLGGEFVSDRPRQPVEYKEAGLWMRDNLEPGLVFTRKPQVAYYANMPSTGPLDTDTLEEALARAKEAQARYMVVDERYAPASLRSLLEPAQAPPSLGFLQEFNHHPQARLVVYRIQP